MITTILFDFGSTLDGPVYWLDRFVDQYRAAGFAISRDRLDPAYSHAIAAAGRAPRAISRFGMKDLVRFLAGQQVELLASEHPPNSGLPLDSRGRSRLVETVSTGFVVQMRRDLEHSRAVIEKLKPRYRLGIVANWYGDLDRILAEVQMSALFAVVVDSAKVGFRKPDSRMFTTAMAAAGSRPETTAMVGDSVEKDCVPARALGMKTVLYRPLGEKTASLEAAADFTIASLDELLELYW